MKFDITTTMLNHKYMSATGLFAVFDRELPESER